MTHCASRIQLWYRIRHMSAVARAQRVRMQQCATRLRAVYLGHAGRRATRERRAQLRATKLQACWRGHCGRADAARWAAAVRRREREAAARRSAEREAEARRLQVLAQSNRGMVEVFAQEPPRPPPPVLSGHVSSFPPVLGGHVPSFPPY